MRAAWVRKKARGFKFSAETIQQIKLAHLKKIQDAPKRACAECGELFPVIRDYDPPKIICNRCGKRHHHRLELRRLHEKQGYSGYGFRPCKICGKPFKKTTSKACLCSDECRSISKRAIGNENQKKRHQRLKYNPNYLFSRFLLRMIRRAVKFKSLPSSKYVNYTAYDFRAHIESLFKPGMTWDNYGTWHIDHMRPLISFNFFNFDGSENLEEIRRAASLENLQPLWADENLRKNSKWA